MVSEDYSQAPLLEQGRIVGLLNKESIANWMGRKAIEQTPDFFLSETTIGDIIPSDASSDNYKIISRKTNLVEGRDQFIDMLGSAIPLEALLITEGGRDNEKLLGIITRSEDLGTIIKNI